MQTNDAGHASEILRLMSFFDAALLHVTPVERKMEGFLAKIHTHIYHVCPWGKPLWLPGKKIIVADAD